MDEMAFVLALKALRGTPAETKQLARVSSLDETVLAKGSAIEAVGIPTYVDDVAQYAAFGITEKGWYVFAGITAPAGVTVTE